MGLLELDEEPFKQRHFWELTGHRGQPSQGSKVLDREQLEALLRVEAQGTQELLTHQEQGTACSPEDTSNGWAQLPTPAPAHHDEAHVKLAHGGQNQVLRFTYPNNQGLAGAAPSHLNFANDVEALTLSTAEVLTRERRKSVGDHDLRPGLNTGLSSRSR